MYLYKKQSDNKVAFIYKFLNTNPHFVVKSTQRALGTQFSSVLLKSTLSGNTVKVFHLISLPVNKVNEHSICDISY